MQNENFAESARGGGGEGRNGMGRGKGFVFVVILSIDYEGQKSEDLMKSDPRGTKY